MLISSVTTLKLEDIVKGGDGPKIYQLYVRGDDKWVAERVKQAMGAGYDAFCITVDTAGLFTPRARHRQALREVVAHRGDRPGSSGRRSHGTTSNACSDQFPDVKFILKGIGCAEDAELAVKEGRVGRLLLEPWRPPARHGRGSTAVLPEIVAAAKGKARSWSTAASAAALTS
jgi:glycolate oxidase